MTRKLRMNVPIERHAREIYTRAMYERFCYYLYKSGSFAIKERTRSNRFVVIHAVDIGIEGARQHIVHFDKGVMIHCSCGLFEHMGMICRHAIKVPTPKNLIHQL